MLFCGVGVGGADTNAEAKRAARRMRSSKKKKNHHESGRRLREKPSVSRQPRVATNLHRIARLTLRTQWRHPQACTSGRQTYRSHIPGLAYAASADRPVIREGLEVEAY